MKNKCCINGCGERGVWMWFAGIVYCAGHKAVLVARHGPVVGCAHEGRKVGKPRWWRQVRAARGASDAPATEEVRRAQEL